MGEKVLGTDEVEFETVGDMVTREVFNVGSRVGKMVGEVGEEVGKFVGSRVGSGMEILKSNTLQQNKQIESKRKIG